MYVHMYVYIHILQLTNRNMTECTRQKIVNDSSQYEFRLKHFSNKTKIIDMGGFSSQLLETATTNEVVYITEAGFSRAGVHVDRY